MLKKSKLKSLMRPWFHECTKTPIIRQSKTGLYAQTNDYGPYCMEVPIVYFSHWIVNHYYQNTQKISYNSPSVSLYFSCFISFFHGNWCDLFTDTHWSYFTNNVTIVTLARGIQWNNPEVYTASKIISTKPPHNTMKPEAGAYFVSWTAHKTYAKCFRETFGQHYFKIWHI